MITIATKALQGLLWGFFCVLGERAACYALSHYRDRQLSRQPFYGKPPYAQWPRG